MKALDIKTNSIHHVISINFREGFITMYSAEYGYTSERLVQVKLIREENDPEIIQNLES